MCSIVATIFTRRNISTSPHILVSLFLPVGASLWAMSEALRVPCASRGHTTFFLLSPHHSVLPKSLKIATTSTKQLMATHTTYPTHTTRTKTWCKNYHMTEFTHVPRCPCFYLSCHCLLVTQVTIRFCQATKNQFKILKTRTLWCTKKGEAYYWNILGPLMFEKWVFLLAWWVLCLICP